MCVGGGGSNRPPTTGGGNTIDDQMQGSGGGKNQYWSEGTLGGSGRSGSTNSRGSNWKNNPDWDQQWYDKGYKEGDWVSTRNQSDRTT